MRAIHTNVVVRYQTGNKPEQTAKPRAVIDAGDIV